MWSEGRTCRGGQGGSQRIATQGGIDPLLLQEALGEADALGGYGRLAPRKT